MKMHTIKMNQKTEKEARAYINDLLEKGNSKFMAFNYLIGHIDDTGVFVFSCRAKGAGLSEFEGRLITKEDGIYLVGNIQPRQSKMKLLYGLIAFNMILGLMLMFSANVLLKLVSIPFLTIPWLNVLVAKKGNYLKASLRKIFNSAE